MKKFKLINTFLKVGKIIAIVCIPLFALLLVIFTVLGIIGVLNVTSTGGSTEELAVAVGVLVSNITQFVLYEAFAIVGLILNGIAIKGVKAASSKAEIKKPAILAIVSGVLFTIFGIPAGILALTLSEANFAEIKKSEAVEPAAEQPAEQPAENK